VNRGDPKLYANCPWSDDNGKELDEQVCEGLNCSNFATEKIVLRAGDESLTFFICSDCVKEFSGDE
jgi:hypothetical protein